MKKIIAGTIAGIAALGLLGAVTAQPAAADGFFHQNTGNQNNKNLMRNLGLGLGAAAVIEGVQGKDTNALLLGAGAALAGSQYEKDRKAQDGNHDFRHDDRRGDNFRRNDRDNRNDHDDFRHDNRVGYNRYDHDRDFHRDGDFRHR